MGLMLQGSARYHGFRIRGLEVTALSGLYGLLRIHGLSLRAFGLGIEGLWFRVWGFRVDRAVRIEWAHNSRLRSLGFGV